MQISLYVTYIVLTSVIEKAVWAPHHGQWPTDQIQDVADNDRLLQRATRLTRRRLSSIASRPIAGGEKTQRVRPAIDKLQRVAVPFGADREAALDLEQEEACYKRPPSGRWPSRSHDLNPVHAAMPVASCGVKSAVGSARRRATCRVDEADLHAIHAERPILQIPTRLEGIIE